MPNLHETQMGQKFFMRDIPELIKGINRLANVLEKQNQEEEKEDKKERTKIDNENLTISIKENIEQILRIMCFGTSREWSENMIERIVDTTVIQKNCMEDYTTPNQELIISALLEIVFNMD